ncbi:MAG TPA: serine hydrolase [Candidatus Saccharimonadales bacterium]|nr:serine hydrolase [Candidatus Saccharimonadales bacterium]
MTINDTPIATTNAPQQGGDQSQSQHQDASWYAKRLILKLQLAKQVYENEKKGIDTSAIVYDITDNKPVFSHDVNYEHYAASISKLFVTSLLLEDLRAGTTTLDTQVSWDASDRRAGAGVYDSASSPLTATVRDVLFDMLNHSGNTAVRIIVNKVLGGADAVNQRYASEYPNLKVTKLQPVAGTSGFLLGYTTAGETNFILDKLYSQTDTYGAFVKNALATNIFDDYGPRSQVKDKDNITVIDKQGQLNDPEGNNRHDVGVIENAKNGHKLRYVLMTTNYEQPAGVLTSDAVASLQAFGRDMLRFEGDKTPKPTEQPDSLKSQSESAVENKRTVY